MLYGSERNDVWGEMRWQFWEGPREQWWEQVWCKSDGEKEGRGANGDPGIEGNSGSDGKGKRSEMVQACVEEGWWACFEKSVTVWSEWQEEARMAKEDVEDTSGEGEQDCWFGDCWQSGVNLATPIYGDKPISKLDCWWWWL